MNVYKTGKIKSFFMNNYVYILLFIVSLFVAITVYKIMEFPYFFFSDQHQHFDTINGLYGIFFYPIGGGRFFPLANMEFYPILMSGMDLENMAFFIYAIESLKFITFSFFFFYMLKLYCNNTVVAFLSFSLFVIVFSRTFSMLSIFAHSIFPEPLILVLLVIFCVFYFHAITTDKLVNYIIAILAMTYALYLKEPVFSSFLVLVFMRFVFFRKEMSSREKLFQYVILLNCILFLCLYFSLAYTSGSTYSSGRFQGDLFDLLGQILIQYGFIVPLVIALVRVYWVVFHKSIVMLADIFLLMSLAYMSCFIVLALASHYYFLPAVLFLVPAYALYAKTFLEYYGGRVQRFFPFPILFLIIVVSSVFMVREPFRRGFHNGEKVVTHETLELMQEIKIQGNEFLFYSLPLDEYDVPFHHAQDNWVFYTYRKFLENYQGFSKNSIVEFSDISVFTNALDAGGIGLISAVTPQVEALFNETYPQYKLFLTGCAFLLVHENYVASFLPLYHEFLQELDQQDIKNSPIPRIFRHAEKLGYNSSL